MPDHQDDAVACQLVWRGDRLIRVAEVVGHDELDLLPEDAAFGEIRGRHPGAALELLAEPGLSAGHWAGDASATAAWAPSAAAEMTAALSGQIDFVQDPPLEALGSIRTRPGFKLAETGELRVLLLGLNQGTPELHSGDIPGANPFKDKRVRQALYNAIDMEAIRSDVMAGLAIPTGITIPPGVHGYAPELDRRLPYDPTRTKALLAEAGYPQGFSVTLDCPNNRYLNVDAQPKEIHFAKLFERRTDFYLLGYLTPSFDSALHFRELYHSRAGRWGATGYANPALDALIARIDAELGTHGRDALIEEAWRMILDDIVVIPLHRQMIVWAMRDDLNLPVSPLNSPTFSRAMLKQR
jgi:peptide/nickel transport system substrate-binding protein